MKFLLYRTLRHIFRTEKALMERNLCGKLFMS